MPAPGQAKLPMGHSIGTCVAYAVPSPPTSAATFMSSYDEIVGKMLFIVGTCLMNNKPETANWGGKVSAGLNSGLWIVLQGSLTDGASAIPTLNGTSEPADISSWLEEPASS